MKNIISKITLLILLTFVSSCVDKDFDEPPVGGVDPAGLVANTTIAQLKTFFAGSGTSTKLPDSIIVAGIVVSSDEAGNIYKDLIIEDATAGVLIRVDRSATYLLMPVGRRIFLKCAGLYISDYGGLIQIGVNNGTGVGRIPDLLIDQHLIRGMWGLPVPIMATQNFSSLSVLTDQNKLVRLDSVYFDNSAVCNTWADIVNGASANRTLKDKNGNSITVRSSNYSTFAGNYIPGGTGSLIGIFQVYNGVPQFVIRSLADVVNFPPNNCATLNNPAHTIADLRALFTGALRYIPAGSDIEGVVISDKDNLNITGNNIVIQDATGGITVRFTTPNTYTPGQKIKIDVSGQELSEYNGLLQVNNVLISLSSVTGTGTITPRLATIPDIIANGEAWESTLVKIANVTISGGTAGTYSGSATLTDVSSNILTLFTRSAATFSGTAYPTTTVSVTGIVSDFNGRQLNIRNTTDVQP